MAFLYEKIDALREYGSSAVLPPYIPENLNPSFELRLYQKQAFENFITHFESDNCPKPTQDHGRVDAVSLQAGISEFLVLCQPFKHR